MAHFAELDGNNQVIRVIVADQDFIDSGLVGDPTNWKQCSYNTEKGVHKMGGTPLRKNYPGPGYSYDEQKDAFIPPKPKNLSSFILDEETAQWKAPKEMPTKKPKKDKMWKWKESILDYEEVDIPVKNPVLENEDLKKLIKKVDINAR